MVNVSEFRTYVTPHLIGVSDMLVDRAIVDAAIEFCEGSLIVAETFDTFTTAIGTPDYDLDAPTGQRVIRVMRAWCDASEMTAMAADDMPLGAYGSVSSSLSRPQAFHEISAGVMGLYPIPDAAYTVTIRAALKPNRNATQLADVLWEGWADTIADGALARLYGQLSQQWGNTALSIVHTQRFRVGINRALIEAHRQFTRAEARISVPRI